MSDDTATVLFVLILGVALIVGLFALIIPEPAETAVIAVDRLDIAVLDFANGSSWEGAGTTLRARTETRLVNTPGISVFSRVQLDQLLAEQALGESGAVNPVTAVRIGSLIGVNKLVTGTVYSAQTTAEESPICEAWSGGNCIATVPGVRYGVRVLAQVEVLNAHTGQIEHAVDLAGSADELFRQDAFFPGYDALVAEAADDIADRIASILGATYTRELRYGLYRGARTKRHGFVGEDETRRFRASDDTVHVVVHFTRVRENDGFQLLWHGPSGLVETTEDIVDPGTWRLYQLELGGRTTGKHIVTGVLAGHEAFRAEFIVEP
jgi:hypothetical protein